MNPDNFTQAVAEALGAAQQIAQSATIKKSIFPTS